VHHLSQAVAHFPQAAWCRGDARGLEARRDPLEDVPAHLLRRAAADARPGGALEPLHRNEGAWATSGRSGTGRRSWRYRVKQYAAKLGGRLEALRAVAFGTTCDTTGLDSQLDRV